MDKQETESDAASQPAVSSDRANIENLDHAVTPAAANDYLTPLEVEMKIRFYDKLSYAWLGSAALVYPAVHFSLKRANIKRKLYVPFAAGVSFLTASLLSIKFTYDFMGECLELPPSEYASSAELHFTLKRYGLIYIHQDGKKKYSILSPSEKNITRDTSQAISLTPQPTDGSTEKEQLIDHVTMEQRSIPTQKE